MNNESQPIRIIRILKNNGAIAHIEFYSDTDGRDHILKVEQFKDVYGWTNEEILAGTVGEKDGNS